MARDYILWNLREAAEELSRTISALESDADYTEAELMLAMGHLYHHLNTAWNARHATTARIEACSEEDFKAWSQFPDDLPVLGASDDE